MAKRVRAIALLAASLVLASCEAKFDSTLVVNDDESGSFAIELSLDDELRELLEEQGGRQFLDFDRLAEVPPGWEAEQFTEGLFQGIRVSTEFTDFDQLADRLDSFRRRLEAAEVALPDTFQTLGLSREGDIFRFEADLSQMMEGITALAGQEVGGLDVGQVIDTIFTIRIIVTLPGEVLEHNAGSLEGNTLVWEIDSAATTGVLRATSDASSGPSPASIAGVVALVAAVGGLLSLALRRSRRRRAEELEAARLVDSGLA